MTPKNLIRAIATKRNIWKQHGVCQTERKKRLSANPAERVAWRPTIELDSCIQAAEYRKRAGKANHGSQGLGLHEAHRNRKKDSKQAEERHAALEEFATKIEEDLSVKDLIN